MTLDVTIMRRDIVADSQTTLRGYPMRAVAVKPGKSYSAHLVDIDEPEMGPHQVLVEVEAIGIDGTDREINQGGYGKPPDGDDFLVMGHESLARVRVGWRQRAPLQAGGSCDRPGTASRGLRQLPPRGI